MAKRVYTAEQLARKKECNRRWNANAYQANPKAAKAKSKAFDLANPAYALYKGMRSSSKKRGQVLEVSLEDVKEILAPMTCSLTGKLLVVGAGDWGPSIDRIDSSIGYVPGNIRLVAWCVNRALSDKGDGLLLEIARALVLKHGFEENKSD